MPQATKELRERWDECSAFDQIEWNFCCDRGGVIRPRPGYTPSPDDMSAITYLIQEWDYGYEPSWPS